MANGVGMGRRNWLALESFEGMDACKDDGAGCVSCVDAGDVCKSVALGEADANEVVEGPVPSS